MKTRNGFVSNSSSTSFVIICPKKAFDNYTKKAHPFYKAWIKEYHSNLETKKFLGEEVIIINEIISSEDSYGLEEWKGKLPEEVNNYGDNDETNFDGREVLGAIAEGLERFSKDVISIQESR